MAWVEGQHLKLQTSLEDISTLLKVCKNDSVAMMVMMMMTTMMMMMTMVMMTTMTTTKI
jgi:hypothetical protein